MGLVSKKPKKPRTPPWPAYPKWSTAAWWGFIRGKLRNAHQRWPPANEALLKARRKSESTNKKLKWEFECSECHGWFPQTKVERDHVIPCGPLQSFDDLPRFVERMFCDVEGYAILCKPCHVVKTNRERSEK